MDVFSQNDFPVSLAIFLSFFLAIIGRSERTEKSLVWLKAMGKAGNGGVKVREFVVILCAHPPKPRQSGRGYKQNFTTPNTYNPTSGGCNYDLARRSLEITKDSENCVRETDISHRLDTIPTIFEGPCNAYLLNHAMGKWIDRTSTVRHLSWGATKRNYWLTSKHNGCCGIDLNATAAKEIFVKGSLANVSTSIRKTAW